MTGNGDQLSIIKDIHQAVVDGNVAKLSALLKTSNTAVDEPDEDGMTALQQACYRGNAEIAKLLVSSGANVNWSKHKQGYTALMFAALSGKLEIVQYILSCGARNDAVNCLKRTASEMSAFVGNYFATALINTFIAENELTQFSQTKFEDTKLYLRSDLTKPLHDLIICLNFAPSKVFLFLSSAVGKPILENWKNVVSILEELAAQHFTPHRTNEHISLKLHLLSAFVKYAGEFLEKEANRLEPHFILEQLIKIMLRGADPHGLPKGQEILLRKSIVSFPHSESSLWQQTVLEIGKVDPGKSPTALSILENTINGFSPFARSHTRSSGTGAAHNEPCATCNDMTMAAGQTDVAVKLCSRCHDVAYCSVACQKLHWFTHKKYCPILKEHHDSVASSKPETRKPGEDDIKKITEEIQDKLRAN